MKLCEYFIRFLVCVQNECQPYKYEVLKANCLKHLSSMFNSTTISTFFPHKEQSYKNKQLKTQYQVSQKPHRNSKTN